MGQYPDDRCGNLAWFLPDQRRYRHQRLADCFPVSVNCSTPGYRHDLILYAVALLETNFSSNIVTTTVVSAVALSVLTALPAGAVSVGAVVCMVGFAAAVSNMTPAGQSTINTVAIGSGWTTTKDMFIWGGIFALMALVVLTFFAYPLGTLIIG